MKTIFVEILIIAGCVAGFALAGTPLVMLAYGWVAAAVIIWVRELYTS